MVMSQQSKRSSMILLQKKGKSTNTKITLMSGQKRQKIQQGLSPRLRAFAEKLIKQVLIQALIKIIVQFNYNKQFMITPLSINKRWNRWGWIEKWPHNGRSYSFYLGQQESMQIKVVSDTQIQIYKMERQLFLQILRDYSKTDVLETSLKFLRDLRQQKLQNFVCFNEQGHLQIKNYNIVLQPHKLGQLDYQSSLALLSYEVILFIVKFRRQEYENGLQMSMRQKLIVYINNLYPRAINKEAKKEIAKLFNFDGIMEKTNSDFQPQLFQFASINHHIVYNPTFITQQIFRIFLRTNQTSLLEGNSGIGKSLSIKLMVELFNIITNYRIIRQNSLEDLRQFINLGIIDQKYFNSIPKVYYIIISENFSQKKCYKMIQNQSNFTIPTFTMQAKFGQFSVNIFNIRCDLYKKEMKVIFAIDQINVYYSLVRQLVTIKSQMKSYAGQVNKLRQLHYQKTLNLISQIRFAINPIRENFYCLFNSFPNIEIGLPETCQCTEFLKTGVPRFSLKYPSIRSNSYGFLEMIHTVLFQYRKSLYKKSLLEGQVSVKIILADQKLNQLSMIFKQNILEVLYEQNKNQAGELTHLRIYQFFSFFDTFKQLLNEVMPNTSYQSEDKEIFQNADYLIGQIKQYSISESIKRYVNFLNYGNQDMKMRRFVFLFYLKRKTLQYIKNAVNIIGQQYKFYFSIDLPEFDQENVYQDFESAINKQNACINRSNKKIQIFYSPSTFLEIVFRIQTHDNIKDYLIEQFLRQYFDYKSVQGSMLDRCCRNLISQFPVQLTLDTVTHFTVNEQPFSFIHFYKGKNNNIIDPQQKFSDLLLYLRNNTLQDLQYLGAYPRLKNSINAALGSKIIDCLLIKIQNGKYLVKTMDFSVSTTPENINDKINNALNFFADLKQNMMDSANYMFVHYLVIPKQMCGTKEESDFCSIITTPIQELSISFRTNFNKNEYPNLAKQQNHYQILMEMYLKNK